MSDKKFRISDEEFMKNYDRHNKSESRSDKYVKGKNSKSMKVGYWIFLAGAFLAAYYFFSEYYFTEIIKSTP